MDLVVTMDVSSTYHFQIRGTYYGGHDLMACCSKFTIYRLAMIAETALHMAATSSCSWKFPLYIE